MKAAVKQVEVNSTSERTFFVTISQNKEGIDIDVEDKTNENIFVWDLKVISHYKLEAMSAEDRVSFTDDIDSRGEHTTKDYIIPYDAWLENITAEELIDFLDVEIVAAIDEAIKNKEL